MARAPPAALTHCGAESEALALLQRIERGEAAVAAEAVEDGIVHAAHRHWWSAARGAVNHLRASNVAIGSEARRAVTELRDEATAVLNLMRQTKMDEAVISCAVMWAQGESSVRATPAAARPAARSPCAIAPPPRAFHLSVKPPGGSTPVTVLNVDNEVVEINATHLSFSGIGRQKPKTYVVNLEFFEPIDAENSSWSLARWAR